MTTVIKHATAADLLSALPALLGSVPRNSVVLLGFRGKRTHATLRFDLPSRGFTRFASTAVGTFCKIPEVDGVVPVICTDAPFRVPSDLLAVLLRRFEQAGFEIKDALLVGRDGWGSHFDPDLPPSGRPLGEIEVLEPAPSLSARVPRADELACRRMATELDRLQKLIDDPDAGGDDLEVLADLPFFAENALEWRAAEVTSRGPLLLFALIGPPARDLVMLQWAFGIELGDALWSPESHPNVDAHAAELILGHRPRPSTARVEAAMTLLTTLISRADDRHRVAPLCMLAWLNWALGRGSVAGIRIDEARSIDPAYSMGQLLGTLFSSGVLPEWLFSSPQIAAHS